MKYKLKKHPEDSAMVEATYKWQDKILLAFVVHEDCLEDEDMKKELEEHGEVMVELSCCKS